MRSCSRLFIGRRWVGPFGRDGSSSGLLAPFGGSKESGTGRERGAFGPDECVEVTAVTGLPA